MLEFLVPYIYFTMNVHEILCAFYHVGKQNDFNKGSNILCGAGASITHCNYRVSEAVKISVT